MNDLEWTLNKIVARLDSETKTNKFDEIEFNGHKFIINKCENYSGNSFSQKDLDTWKFVFIRTDNEDSYGPRVLLANSNDNKEYTLRVG